MIDKGSNCRNCKALSRRAIQQDCITSQSGDPIFETRALESLEAEPGSAKSSIFLLSVDTGGLPCHSHTSTRKTSFLCLMNKAPMSSVYIEDLERFSNGL